MQKHMNAKQEIKAFVTPLKCQAESVIADQKTAASTGNLKLRNTQDRTQQHVVKSGSRSCLKVHHGNSARNKTTTTVNRTTSQLKLQASRNTPATPTNSNQKTNIDCASPKTPHQLGSFKSKRALNFFDCTTPTPIRTRSPLAQSTPQSPVGPQIIRLAHHGSAQCMRKAITQLDIRKQLELANASAKIKESFIRCEEDGVYVLQGADAKTCALQIYCPNMLTAWRQRRSEVETLAQQLKDSQLEVHKIKMRKHVYFELLKKEEQRNQQLKLQYKETKELLVNKEERCREQQLQKAELQVELKEMQAQLVAKQSQRQDLSQAYEESVEQLKVTRMEQCLLQTNQAQQLYQLTILETEHFELNRQFNELAGKALERAQQRLDMQSQQWLLDKMQSDVQLFELNLIRRQKEQAVQAEDTLASALKQDIARLEAKLERLRLSRWQICRQTVENMWHKTRPYQGVGCELLLLAFCHLMPNFLTLQSMGFLRWNARMPSLKLPIERASIIIKPQWA